MDIQCETHTHAHTHTHTHTHAHTCLRVSPPSLQATTRALLLIEGALELACGLAHALDAAVALRLRATLSRDALTVTASERHDARLSRLDRAIVAWALWTGALPPASLRANGGSA